jgi:hypothetical protein
LAKQAVELFAIGCTSTLPRWNLGATEEPEVTE